MRTRRWLILSVCSGAVLAAAGWQEAAARVTLKAQVPDTREAVALTAAERDQVLAEMRQMRESLSLIIQAIASNDVPSVVAPARWSGVAAAADPALERKLPKLFFHLGFDTHKKFDALADLALRGGTPAEVLAGLNKITANCVSCHASYKIEVVP